MSRIREDITRLTACLTTPADTAGDRPELLTLLLGHLPIRAGLWRLPAARLLFPDSSRIMVAREDEQNLVMECIGDRVDHVSAELISDCSACVIVPPSGASPELVADLDSDRLAIITGGDQAAIVAAYALVKGLSVPLDVPVELIVVGQQEDQGRETAERLADAALRHLGRVVDYRGVIPAIGADTGLAQSRMLPRPADGLLSVARTARGGVSIDQQPDAEASHRVVNGEAPNSHETERVVPESPAKTILDPLPDPERVVQKATPFTESNHVPLVTAPINPRAMEPVPSMEPSMEPSMAAPMAPPPPRTTAAPGPSSSTHALSVHLPDLKPLAIRCPDHESAEFALDQAGKLNLLVSASEAGHVPAILGWATRHWSLLGQVVSELPSESVDPVVHVLGQDAKTLIGLRDTPWRVHLLVQVQEARTRRTGLRATDLRRTDAQGR